MVEDGVAVIGSGGIGGYIAGALSGAGRPVTLCVRTPFERLTIRSGGETREADVRIATDPAKVAPARWILLTTKAQDSLGAKPWLDALARPGSTLVMVQNGIDHLERAAPIAGPAKVVPAIIYCSVERERPGHIVHHGSARIVVPRDEGSADFADVFAGSPFKIEEVDDFPTAAWQKFLGNLIANPITSLTLRRMGVFGEEPGILALARSLLDEAILVAKAEGTAITEADTDKLMATYPKFNPAGGSSMLYDRLAGRPLEYEALTGALVRRAERHGIAVPVHRTVLALLEAVSGRPLDRAG